jgi:hypothetical protein
MEQNYNNLNDCCHQQKKKLDDLKKDLNFNIQRNQTLY